MERAQIVTDLGFGDAGKGTTIDYLARQASSAVVVRHSGGAQAAHNVVTPDGRHHTFSQFGSGTFVPGVKTHLSRFMMVSPGMMFSEAHHLDALGVPNVWERLSIDEAAPIILPWHRAANRLRELARGSGRHGSCGVGISEVQMDLLTDPNGVIRAGDLREPRRIIGRLRALQRAKAAQMKDFEQFTSDAALEAWGILTDPDLPELLAYQYLQWNTTGLRIEPGSYLGTLAETHEALLFEGSQGVLLDEWYGFHPYTTWSTTTSENAETLLREISSTAPITRIGVMRAYTTRHGPGPFVTEDPALAIPLAELHNGMGEWMGAFRYGHLDLVAHAYAIQATGGVDALAVTGLDRSDSWQVCDSYQLGNSGNARDFFTLSKGGEVVGIKLGKKGNLDRQALLTEHLMSCSPLYRQAGTLDDSELLCTIESALGAPITIASYGPSAADKRVPVAV